MLWVSEQSRWPSGEPGRLPGWRTLGPEPVRKEGDAGQAEGTALSKAWS